MDWFKLVPGARAFHETRIFISQDQGGGCASAEVVNDGRRPRVLGKRCGGLVPAGKDPGGSAPPPGYAAEDAHGTVAAQDGRSGPSDENADVAASVPNDFGRQILNGLMILSDGGMEAVDPRTERMGNE